MPRASLFAQIALAQIALAQIALALDNGLAVTPPMGWRSWNLYGANVNQELIQDIMLGMTSRRNTVDGVPTSLLDLGYHTVGLDDAWQECGSYGPQQNSYHDAAGNPVVNTARFPSMSNMTAYAHSLGLKAGWYGNNCICKDHCSDEACYAGDVNALLAYGYDAVKLDGCGAEYNLDLWSSLIASHGKAIEIENCHWGGTIPNSTWCPYNFYRTSGDVRANFDSILGNIKTVLPLAAKNLSTPGCWAYPDMLEVGCAAGPGGSSDSGLTLGETRSHFGAWSIVSSPLTLSHNVNNHSMQDFIWPIIANPEAIAVNQLYFGFSGSAFFSTIQPPVATGDYVLVFPCNTSDHTQHGFTYDAAAQAIRFGGKCVDASDSSQVMLAACSGSAAQTWSYSSATKYFIDKADRNCLDVWASNGPPGGPGVQTYGCHGAQGQEWAIDAASETISATRDGFCLSSRKAVPDAVKYFYKPMSWEGHKAAVLLINIDAQPADLEFVFSDVPGLSGTNCAVRDIWGRKDLGSFTASYTAVAVGVHDSAFLMLTCA